MFKNMVLGIDTYKERNPSYETYFVNIVRWILDKKGLVFVAMEENKYVGFILAYVRNEDYNDKQCYGFCEDIWVDKEHRNGEVAEKLIQTATEEAKKHGIKRIEFVTEYSKNLLDIWKRKGYKPTLITFSQEVA
jgi:GNAT superfamily N-acetyltransferase